MKQFEQFLEVYRVRSKNYEDWEYLLIMAMIYIVLHYGLFENDASNLDQLIKLHDCTHPAYLLKLSSFFNYDNGPG
jgi:hypothetical protein